MRRAGLRALWRRPASLWALNCAPLALDFCLSEAPGKEGASERPAKPAKVYREGKGFWLTEIYSVVRTRGAFSGAQAAHCTKLRVPLARCYDKYVEVSYIHSRILRCYLIGLTLPALPGGLSEAPPAKPGLRGKAGAFGGAKGAKLCAFSAGLKGGTPGRQFGF